MTAVVKVDHVSKAYRLGETQTSLREAIAQLGKRLVRPNKQPAADPIFWALNDVNFQVEEGDILGIIGHNGAGKSTIMKLLSRVTFPTAGQIVTQGRLAALIELGAGFHPDLSGRENIFLNGAILGLKEREIKAQFSQIVEFAGLERFIDTPVKRYSSGMYVRLAFAVAAHIRADVLLIDEVLSVGDSAFQQKCLDKMRELHRNGTTIIFISHSMWTVQSFCTRALLLRDGFVQTIGSPDEVIELYRQQDREDMLAYTTGTSSESVPEAQSEVSPETTITQVEILNAQGSPQTEFNFYEKVLIRVHYAAARELKTPAFLLRISRADGLVCCAISNRNVPGADEQYIEGAGVFEVLVGPLALIPDVYTINAIIYDRVSPIVYAHHGKQTVRIKGDLSGSSDAGVYAPDVEWKVAQE